MLKYLKVTRELKLTLRVGDMSVLKWWVEASYVVHQDCWGHMGAMISLGKGSVSTLSTKKINRKSSTEGEMIGVDDTMEKILRPGYFIDAQGVQDCTQQNYTEKQ